LEGKDGAVVAVWNDSTVESSGRIKENTNFNLHNMMMMVMMNDHDLVEGESIRDVSPRLQL
jgi:hypothetical protein